MLRAKLRESFDDSCSRSVTLTTHVPTPLCAPRAPRQASSSSRGKASTPAASPYKWCIKWYYVPPSVTPSPMLRAPRGSQLTDHSSYVPSRLKKENSILPPSCRPDHACASCLMLQPSISHQARAPPAPRPPAPPASQPLPSPFSSPLLGPPVRRRRQLSLLFRTRVIADDNFRRQMTVGFDCELTFRL